MMIFQFNDCIPRINDEIIVLQSIEDTISEYKLLKDKFPEDVDGVISIELNQLILCNEKSLQDFLPLIKNDAKRNYAYNIFTKYPLESQYEKLEANFDDSTKYKFWLHEGVSHDAFNLKIGHDKNATLFTLALHENLKQNILKISADSGEEYVLDNLYGQSQNTSYIEEVIQKEIDSKKNNLTNLKDVLKQPILSGKLIRTFEKSSKRLQDSIIELFKEVLDLKKRNQKVPETLLKNVTPEKETKIQLWELKIREPEVMRLYHTIHNGRFILASLEKKPLKDRKTMAQDEHIKNAISMIKQII